MTRLMVFMPYGVIPLDPVTWPGASAFLVGAWIFRSDIGPPAAPGQQVTSWRSPFNGARLPFRGRLPEIARFAPFSHGPLGGVFPMAHRGRLMVVIASWLGPTLPLQSQQPSPLPECPADQVHAFDFLVGHFHGTVYDLTPSDSTAPGVSAQVSAEKVVTGCALLERWHFQQNGAVEDEVVVIRAFDVSTRAWSYDLANAHLNHLTWAGAVMGGSQYFVYTFSDKDKTVEARIRWVPTPDGYSEQVSRSSDGGRTWVNTRHINYVRDSH
jgi:hypothetical protein